MRVYIHKARINDFGSLDVLPVKLVSLLTVGKKRNVAGIRREKKAVIF